MSTARKQREPAAAMRHLRRELEQEIHNRKERLKEIYQENGKTDYDAGRVKGFKEAAEMVADYFDHWM